MDRLYRAVRKYEEESESRGLSNALPLLLLAIQSGAYSELEQRKFLEDKFQTGNMWALVRQSDSFVADSSSKDRVVVVGNSQAWTAETVKKLKEWRDKQDKTFLWVFANPPRTDLSYEPGPANPLVTDFMEELKQSSNDDVKVIIGAHNLKDDGAYMKSINKYVISGFMDAVARSQQAERVLSAEYGTQGQPYEGEIQGPVFTTGMKALLMANNDAPVYTFGISGFRRTPDNSPDALKRQTFAQEQNLLEIEQGVLEKNIQNFNIVPLDGLVQPDTREECSRFAEGEQCEGLPSLVPSKECPASCTRYLAREAEEKYATRMNPPYPTVPPHSPPPLLS